MTTKVVSDEQMRKVYDRCWEVQRRVKEGTLDPEQVANSLQQLVEGNLLPMDIASQLNRWCAVYKDWFSIEVDPSSIKVPEKEAGFDRLIVVPKGVTMNQVVKMFRQKFSVSVYIEDLDGDVTKNDRVNTESYAIWVRDRVEADEENKNLSANDCASRGIKGETLLERLLHEAIYFGETGKHLDVQNWTLCAGSRRSGGKVPLVHWAPHSRRLEVYWFHLGFADSHLRSRTVVS